MKVKITPIGESAQLIEFNVSLPCGARASVAPVSTLTITQRWAKVINTATTGAASYMQVTKFDIIHNTQYTDLQNQYLQQLQVMQQAQQAQQKTQPILDEINREVGSLSVDEQNVLAKTQEYQMAKQTYEAGFMSFLGTKFSAEYVNSPDGKVAAENLLSTIRKSKEFIQSQIKAKEEKVNTLLELMESDPEMKKRFEELMMNKTAK